MSDLSAPLPPALPAIGCDLCSRLAGAGDAARLPGQLAGFLRTVPAERADRAAGDARDGGRASGQPRHDRWSRLARQAPRRRRPVLPPGQRALLRQPPGDPPHLARHPPRTRPAGPPRWPRPRPSGCSLPAAPGASPTCATVPCCCSAMPARYTGPSWSPSSASMSASPSRVYGCRSPAARPTPKGRGPSSASRAGAPRSPSLRPVPSTRTHLPGRRWAFVLVVA
jgi:hypothetical protein